MAANIVNNNNFLTFNRSDDFTYAGSISGTGAINFDGTGTATLTGDSGTFSGPVIVSAGQLHLAAGSVIGATDLSVGSNGTLSGVGTVQGNVALDGTLAPGNSIGAIGVQGNVAFNSGSLFEVEIEAPNQADLVSATGTATINGGEIVVTKLDAETSYQNGQSYRIVEAGGGVVRSTDFTYANPFLFLTSTLEYGADYVDILLQGSGPSQDFTSVTETYNQRQTATGLNALEQSGDALAIYNELLLLTDPDEARRAFDLSSGEIHASGQHVIDQTFALFSGALRRQGGGDLPGAVDAPGVIAIDQAAEPVATTHLASAWLAPLGGRGVVMGDGNAATLDWVAGGLAGGAGWSVDAGSGDAWLGVGVGYLHSGGNVDARVSALAASNFGAGLSGGWSDDAWTLSGSLAYMLSALSTERRISFAGIDRLAHADYVTQTVGVSGEASYGFALSDHMTVSPLATLDAAWSGHGGYSESGAGALNTAGSPQSWVRLDTGIGFSIAYVMPTERGTVTVHGRAVWEHSFASTTPHQGMTLAGSPTAFDVRGTDAGRDRLKIGAGVAYEVTEDLSVRADYTGTFSSSTSSHAATLGLKLTF